MRVFRHILLGLILSCMPVLAWSAPLRAEVAADPTVSTHETDTAEAPVRRAPGWRPTYPAAIIQVNPGAVATPPPEAFPVDELPMPDRWRIIETFGTHARWYDPYNQNTLKGDRPLPGLEDWFFAFNGVSDSVLELRSFPVPVGGPTTENPNSLDAFGRSDSLVASQTILLGASLFKGSTAFKPPELEFHISLGFNANYAVIGERGLLSIASSRGPRRHDQFLALQEAFIDYHLRNVSDHYDFDSLRIGIQPFSSDFRGFLFQDNQLGIRLFGNRDNNKFQYNLAGFVLVEKDTNSGLNDVGQSLRKDAILVANLYRQDLPVPGITSQITLIYNANREGREVHYDSNGFPVRPALIGNLRPRDYDIVYLGYNLDGHLGRINLTGSIYGALGEDRNSIFTDKATDVRAWFAALEPSIDLDWIRVRLSGLYASGDHNPYDDKETGFDAISENPLIAGADTSYWIRQSVPLVGGGRGVSINGRNGVLNALRSSKEEGQSNFNNPGTVLLGAGADLDLTPNLRVSGNLNHIWFADTAVIQALRQEGSIPNEVGWDYSVAAIWRPLMTQNIVFRLSAAALDPGAGFKDLFTDRVRSGRFYSVLLNTVLAF